MGTAVQQRRNHRLNEPGETAWNRLLDLIPALRNQFRNAKPLQAFTYLPKLSFCSETIVGGHWAMLPSAAGFVDPMLSTGFPLTLLGVERMAALLKDHWGKDTFAEQLGRYAVDTRAELMATSRLIGSLYRTSADFPSFAALSLLYFAAASFSETARRLRRPQLASSFLLHDHPTFGPACAHIHERVHSPLLKEDGTLIEEVMHAIEPIDVAGLTDLSRENRYPIRAEDLLQNAQKLGATPAEVLAMLKECGFSVDVEANRLHSNGRL